jgi:hypothetical protein
MGKNKNNKTLRSAKEVWVVGHVTPQRRALLLLVSQLMLNFDSPYHDNLY